MIFSRSKNTARSINKQISKTYGALKQFVKVRQKLEDANDELSIIVQDSLAKQDAYNRAAQMEQELQNIAFDRITDNNEAIDRIKQLIGEK